MICEACKGNRETCDCERDIKVGDTVEMIIPIVKDGGLSGLLEQRINSGLKNRFTVQQVHKGSQNMMYLKINDENYYHIENFRRLR